MRTDDEIRTEAIEMLAELEHEQWCAWAYAVARSEEISQSRIERWNRLLITPYSKLTEAEKEQDRAWARKAFEICMQVARTLADKSATEAN